MSGQDLDKPTLQPACIKVGIPGHLQLQRQEHAGISDMARQSNGVCMDDLRVQLNCWCATWGFLFVPFRKHCSVTAAS